MEPAARLTPHHPRLGGPHAGGQYPPRPYCDFTPSTPELEQPRASHFL